MTKQGRWPFDFVDIHGRPFDVDGQPVGADDTTGAAEPAAKKTAKQAAAPAARPSNTLSAADLERVFDALLLAGWRRSRSALALWLRALDWPRDRGGAFTPQDLEQALLLLARAGRVKQGGDGGTTPLGDTRQRLGELLRRPQASGWWRQWLWAAGGGYGKPEQLPAYLTLRDEHEARALLRLVLAGDIGEADFTRLANGPLQHALTRGRVGEALEQVLQLGLNPAPAPWWRLLAGLDSLGGLADRPVQASWVEQHVAEAPLPMAGALRLRVAELRLHRGDAAGMAEVLRGDAGAADFLPLLQAAALAQAGRFAEAAPAFAAAWKALSARLGKKRGFAPQSLLQWYPLALMAGSDATAWTTARKFCVAVSGSRTPPPHDLWGLWAHVLAVRLGDESLQAHALAGPATLPGSIDPALNTDPLADRVLLAAWLGRAPEGWQPAAVQAVVAALHRAGLPWKADLVAQACERLGWPAPARPDGAPPPWPVRYYAPPQEAWRDALSAIAALGAQDG
ncbi:MAG: hypothetical protein ACKO3M_07400, partial [Rubrivivax sp.]